MEDSQLQEKGYSFLGNDTFPNLYDALVYERKFKSEYLERQIYVSVKSKLQHAPHGQPPRAFDFFENFIVQIPPYPGQNTFQMPHTRVHSGDQMPPPRGHFTGTKMTEGRRKRLHSQLSNKIFINITKTEKQR